MCRCLALSRSQPYAAPRPAPVARTPILDFHLSLFHTPITMDHTMFNLTTAARSGEPIAAPTNTHSHGDSESDYDDAVYVSVGLQARQISRTESIATS